MSDKEQERLKKLFCDMILEKENIELHDIVKTNPCFLSDHWGKRFSDFCFMQSKLDAKDELLRKAIKLLVLWLPPMSGWGTSLKRSLDFLSKSEIKALRGEE